MVDLLNKKTFKVMSVLSQEEIIWDIQAEICIERTNSIYKQLGRFINITEWVREYYFSYKKWLYEDSQYVYDIFSPINQSMLNAIIEHNNFSDQKLFYWFDVDRNLYEEFEWKYCPISKTKLIQLDEVHPNNRLISSRYPLMFPSVG